MKIALIGYGKMGKTIERIATERGHQIVLKITSKNSADLNAVNLARVDVAIEFTNPESAFENVQKCLHNNVPVVCGSTGWNHQLKAAQDICVANNTALIQSSNFSIGVNVFFEINSQLAKVMNNYPAYDVRMLEVHHTQKKDAPSGTAITLAEKIIKQLSRKNNWSITQPFDNNTLSITAERIDEVPGTHSVTYSSTIDDIELKHTAHNRDGFALGAIVAAEFLKNKKGIFTMKEVLDL
ncbi:MAG: 4-hydroxy-tetrahydrodipicolinate reductase [Chitinophagaceae bacterium]|nr:4-hydroxy-tetrahydrodipicolinate reductase [Chitinophagaceae bacterium]